jgi:hypothetical protein
MWIARFAVPVALVLSLLFACFAPKNHHAPPGTIHAEELLRLAQQAGGCNYTYSQATRAALAQVEVARPAEGASRENLEAALAASGFVLSQVGPPERKIFLVERAGPAGR